ncbi:MAG: Hsp20/alpha crystallin family protein, partial [Bacillota bacterium]
MRSLVPRGFFDSLLDTGFARDIAWPGFFTSVFDRQHPFVDIEETDNMYVVKADVPGFDKENIDIELSDNVLTISGKVDERSETTDTDGGYVRRERRYGAFRRSFMLPDEVDH